MDTTQIVALLVAERDRLTKAIEALQGASAAKRRGRPPKNLLGTVAAPVAESAKPPKRNQSAASKKAQSEKMKAYWAAKHKAKK